MRNATWYFVTDVRWPGVSVVGIALSVFVAPPIIVLALEEENHKRSVAFRIVKNDDLLGRHVLRPLAVALHLLLHLRHPVAADTIEGHDSCETYGPPCRESTRL